MARLKKIFTAIVSITFLCFIPYLMFAPPLGALPFDDVVGKWLAIGIIVCFMLSALYFFILDTLKDYYTFIKDYDTAITSFFLAFFAVGFILQGVWMFGEKDRFASYPVTRTDAIITRVSGYKYIDLSYSYKDANGNRHTGRDNVDMLFRPLLRSMFYQVGDTVPVHYLNASPEVSRLVQQNYLETYIAKAFCILLGSIILLAIIYRIIFRKKIVAAGNQRYDAWLEKRSHENAPIYYSDNEHKE